MRKLLVFILFLFSFSSLASASYINLNTSVVTRAEGDLLNVAITSQNNGDESAYNVQAELLVAGKRILLAKSDEIGIGQSYTAHTRQWLSFKLPGDYPLIIILHYTDANQYPFSALTSAVFRYRSETMPSLILGSMDSKTFWEKGKLSLDFKNLSDSVLELSTRLITPRELSVGENNIKTQVQPRGQGGVDFAVKNFSALSGSSYQVFAVSEYEENGVHRTQITPGFIKIVERRTFLGVDYAYLIIVLVILVLLFAFFQFSPFKKE
jgi:hypothetical protein